MVNHQSRYWCLAGAVFMFHQCSAHLSVTSVMSSHFNHDFMFLLHFYIFVTPVTSMILCVLVLFHKETLIKEVSRVWPQFLAVSHLLSFMEKWRTSSNGHIMRGKIKIKLLKIIWNKHGWDDLKVFRSNDSSCISTATGLLLRKMWSKAPGQLLNGLWGEIVFANGCFEGQDLTFRVKKNCFSYKMLESF